MTDYMDKAIAQAKLAEKHEEVPVGAVVVYQDKVIARGYNLRESKQDSTLHAEMVAIRKACKKIGSWRLIDCDLYVTLEPCPMCMGAIINSRIRHVYFGAYDKKAGACGTNCDLTHGFNHTPLVTGGVKCEICGNMLTQYFKKKR